MSDDDEFNAGQAKGNSSDNTPQLGQRVGGIEESFDAFDALRSVAPVSQQKLGSQLLDKQIRGHATCWNISLMK